MLPLVSEAPSINLRRALHPHLSREKTASNLHLKPSAIPIRSVRPQTQVRMPGPFFCRRAHRYGLRVVLGCFARRTTTVSPQTLVQEIRRFPIQERPYGGAKTPRSRAVLYRFLYRCPDSGSHCVCTIIFNVLKETMSFFMSVLYRDTVTDTAPTCFRDTVLTPILSVFSRRFLHFHPVF
jgi:hypothetical protein